MALLHNDGTTCPGYSCPRWDSGAHRHIMEQAVRLARQERERAAKQA